MANEVMKAYNNCIVQTKSYSIKYDMTMPFKKGATSQSTGTGFFIDNKGHILTCSHCIDDADECYVLIPTEGKKEFRAVVKGFCPYFDIALIKVLDYKNKNYCELDKEEQDNITPGVETFALGFPLGQDNLKITRGIISGQQLNYYQTDTSINPGNSGGPLIYNNKVIGINGAGMLHAENVGYAIPISRYLLIEKSLFGKKTQIIYYPETFGMTHQRTNQHFKKYLENKCTKGGISIKEVYKNSPIASTKLKEQDILCSINGIQIDNYGYLDKRWMDQKMDLNNIMGTLKLGENIAISYWKQGCEKISKGNFILKPYNQPIRQVYPKYDNLDYEIICGLVFMKLTLNHLNDYNLLTSTNVKYKKIENRNEEKVILVNVLLGSDVSDKKILKAGDIVKKVNNKTVKSLSDLRRHIVKPVKHKNGSYVKIESESNTISITSVDCILSEEQKLSYTYMYKPSKLLKQLKAR